MATAMNSTTPYWLASATLPTSGSLSEDLTVDAVVVGGGICGLTTAYLLAKAGKRVVVLERQRCAEADTGHTTAHLTMVTDTRLHELVRLFDRPHAQAVWDAGLAAIGTIDATVRPPGTLRMRRLIACLLLTALCGSLAHAADPSPPRYGMELHEAWIPLPDGVRLEEVEVDLLPIMLKRLTLTGSTLRPRSVAEKAEIARALEARVWPLLTQGKIKPQIFKTFPLAGAAEALMVEAIQLGLDEQDAHRAVDEAAAKLRGARRRKDG